ncbi:MAG: polymerase subunit alpha [Alphaproteobacteria bacterium]|jgi:DNA polymerase-3 subunit alpha|nr:polymerase subunit alpha [Alphaproteobacteria bacterium]
MVNFIHLRVHTAYSLAEGAIKLKDLAKKCQELAMPAVAITDTANLFGALEFSINCAENGIQPLIGCQVYLRRPDTSPSPAGKPLEPDQLVLIVRTEEGYRNLLHLVSDAYLDAQTGELPQVRWEDLKVRQGGLIALTGGPAGTVGRLLAEGQRTAAEEALQELKAIFPGNLYVEIMRHGLAVEDQIEPILIELAYQHDVPLVATNEVFFKDPGMYEAHDALLCIAEGRYLNQDDRRRVTPHHYFKSAQEMSELFADLPEAIQNTVVIAQRCSYMPVPHDPILPPYPTESGRTEAQELRYMAEKGLEERLERQVFTVTTSSEEKEQKRDAYVDRLNYEIAVIEKMGFPGYFLIVADFIQWAKSQGIPVGPGRGSGAGSLVAWALTITDIDPIRFELLFERFLNPERVSMPDFDIDFCQDRRDEVIAYVRQKYGDDRVAHIITFGKMQAKMVLRDVGRVLQLPYGQIDRISKLVPNNPANPVTLEQALELEPLLKLARDTDPAVATMMDMGMKLEGLYRHASTHAAGVVIGDRPLADLVPLYKDEGSALPATQFSMKYVELAGLLKFDFLGLKTLTIIENCCQRLRARDIPLDISQIPLDDPKTFELLQRVETVGVFQVESAGMRDVLRKLCPDRFEDLIALVALYRPGPMDDIPRYLACKHGEEKVTYLHPELQPILEGTYGVMVYQEQVMKIAQVLGGYTLGAADLLRRAMGKKIKSEMDAQRTLFLDGAVKNGVTPQAASQIFDQMAKFAGYGFNKSHSAPYALLLYQTAYLKANHPLEFFAASMTYDLNNTDKLNVFRQEMERLKVPLFPPDINASDVTFSVEGNGIRYALAAIKGVGEAGMKMILAERRAKGPFKDLNDFANRIGTAGANGAMNKRQLENLVAAGAFDGLNSNRQQSHMAIEAILKQAGLAAQETKSRQQNLFGLAVAEGPMGLSLPKVSDWGSLEKLQHEFEALGFFLSAHPLDIYGASLARLGVMASSHLKETSDGAVVKLAGIVLVKQERTSKAGQKFAFVQLSDAQGVFEVAVFSETFARSRELLEPGKALLVSAILKQEAETDGFRLTAQGVQLLDEAMQNLTKMIKIRLHETAQAEALRHVLASTPAGAARICFEVAFSASPSLQILLPNGYHIQAETRSHLLGVPGVLGVEDL